MLDPLKIEPTEDIPIIDFDAATGILKVEGRALPEDAHAFFRPISEWLQAYIKEPHDSTIMELRIDYFNSAAARYIFNLLMFLENLAEADKQVNVIWYYKADDEMIKTKGEEFDSMLDLPFEMKIW